MSHQPEEPRPDQRPDQSVDRPDPEDPPTGPADELDDDFDPAEAPSNPDLVGGSDSGEPTSGAADDDPDAENTGAAEES